jgi:hypothetical protein
VITDEEIDEGDDETTNKADPSVERRRKKKKASRTGVLAGRNPYVAVSGGMIALPLLLLCT